MEEEKRGFDVEASGVTQPQLNLIRSIYLSSGIRPASRQWFSFLSSLVLLLQLSFS
jgi:hypothetical protein